MLQEPKATQNRYIETSSLETLQNEISNSLEKQTGDTKWKVEYVTFEKMIEEGQDALEKSDFIGMGKLALATSYPAKFGGNVTADGKLANKMLDIPR